VVACSTDLSTRADQLDLAAHTTTSPLLYKGLLSADSDGATWRIIEAFSRTGVPFALDASWSAGSGSGANARITVCRSARVCVFARALELRAANLASVENRVGVTVADGYAVTENQWEEPGGPGQGEQDVVIPPFASRVRVDVADTTVLATTIVRLYDGLGTLRTRLPASSLGAGLLVGNAGRMTVQVPSNINWRSVFVLGL
jgi:hypothetical protein